MLLCAIASSSSVTQQMELEIQPPPAVSVTSAINGDDLFDVTVGTCMCEAPSCAGGVVRNGETQTYRSAPRCNYYSIGGSISARSDGTLCYRWTADYKSCNVYPAEPFTSSFTTSSGAAECSRLNGASCTMRRSSEFAGQWFEYKTATTLHASVDRTCDTLPWQPCTENSLCCGAVDGWACRLTSCSHILPNGECDHPQMQPLGATAQTETSMCQPPHGGPLRGPDERLFASWGVKGTQSFN